MKISEIISPESVRLDLTSPSRTSLLQTISEIAGTALGIGASEIFLALSNREKLGSTTAPRVLSDAQRIELLHVLSFARLRLKDKNMQLHRSRHRHSTRARTGCREPLFLMIRLKKPIDFEAVDDAPVDIVCLLLTPVQGSQLNVLAHLARKLRSTEIVGAIRSTSSREEVFSLLADDGAP